jgi:hypothetical protein
MGFSIANYFGVGIEYVGEQGRARAHVTEKKENFVRLFPETYPLGSGNSVNAKIKIVIEDFSWKILKKLAWLTHAFTLLKNICFGFCL